MIVELTPEEVKTLVTSLEYSEDRIRNAPGIPPSIRQNNLGRLALLAQKLRGALGEALSSGS